MMKKICVKCKQEKGINCFYKDIHRKDGLTSLCRDCFRTYNKSTYSRDERRELAKKQKKKCACGGIMSPKAKRCHNCLIDLRKKGMLRYGTPFKKGKEHPNWNEGITPLRKAIQNHPKYEDWRLQVFQRDNFTCQGCKKVGGVLNAHHIKQYREIIRENKIKILDDALHCLVLWDIMNGITLCENCHRKLHLGTNWWKRV